MLCSPYWCQGEVDDYVEDEGPEGVSCGGGMDVASVWVHEEGRKRESECGLDL